MRGGTARLLLGALVAPIVGVAMAPGPLGPWSRPPAPVLALGVVRGPAGAGLHAASLAAGLQQTVASASAPPAAPPPPPPPPPTAPPAPAVGASPPPAPHPLTAALDARLAADPRLAGLQVGLSVWLDGFGEVAARNADLPLLPASNQKLITAMGLLAQVPITDTLVTEVRATGAQNGTALVGDLILVGGGDPTLTTSGPHSLDALAAAVRARGITRVAGALVADESRYDSLRGAGGWLPEHVPVFIGPLSALVVDRNQFRGDAAYAADPVPGNLARFRYALARQGISVAGGDVAAPSPPGSATVAALASTHIGALVTDMLVRSDNLFAELLLKELGRRVRGAGTTADGVAAADATLAALGVHLSGHSADGSGLSRQDRHSTRELQDLLRAAATQPWGTYLLESLPLAGRTGTLARRLRGTAAEANVRAKTGWIDEGRALSGYLTTAGGRRAVFSVVVNGTVPGSPVVGAIDDLVATIAADPS